MWFRPIETRVGPDGALYIVDFYNQAVIHNDTRGPQHGPANAAVRPDRDHYFGRIWRVQHKQAKKLAVPALGSHRPAGLIRAMETSPNAQVKQTAWRLAQENFASDPRLARIKRPMGSSVSRSTSGRGRDDRRGAQGAARHLRAGDRQLDAVGNRCRRDGTGAAYVASAFAHERPQALTEFVALVAPAALPASASQLLVAAAGAGAPAAALKAPVVRAVARMEGGSIAMDAATTAALQKLLDDPATSAAALPIVAKWDKAGALSASADRQAAVLQRELADPKASDDRRAELAASLLAVPTSRAQALATIAPMLVDPAVSDSLKARVTRRSARAPAPTSTP